MYKTGIVNIGVQRNSEAIQRDQILAKKDIALLIALIVIVRDKS